MRIVVNGETCTGHGLCEALLPDTFEVTSEGIVRVLTEECDDRLRPLLEEAIAACPTMSLRMDDETRAQR